MPQSTVEGLVCLEQSPVLWPRVSGDAGLLRTKFAQKAGYIAETYEVVTQDGYILQLDRITGSKKSPSSDNKTAVLLLHGLLDASPTWLVAGPEKALGFILADEGYDVWMGNVRGNRYSRKHLNLTTLDPDYWMFSWHEMGIYDLPAIIDHIIEQIQQKEIFMITHSQGGTVFFVMASERPEYQEKIIAAFTLAPAVFISRTKSTLVQVLLDLANNNYFITCSIGIYEFKPSDTPIQMITKEICRDESPLQILCENYIFLMGGIDVELNKTLLPLILQYVPAGASVKQFAHFGQVVQSSKFRKFDYGFVGNIEKYGKIQPPDYNLGNVTLPVYLHYGANDVIIDVQVCIAFIEKFQFVSNF
ncbi:hypothetical protein K0M31_016524 [Melipona bicolor]|uniref:Partial AB-hydrolase lipase domain-containing protein n=1 Tax=Melipona bicolor TaxID=60889 RepID=A0AA40KEV2_9HYME|nr:hypothetical protein K0M31_016524 [Melipona bicolor]